MIAGSGSNRNKNNSIKANFNVKQYNTFIHELDMYYINEYGLETAYDFTGCFLQFYVKSKYGSFSKRVGTITYTTNTIRLYVSNEELDFYGNYLYELNLTNALGVTTTLLEGKFSIERSVITLFQNIVNEISLGISSIYQLVKTYLVDNKYTLSILSSYLIILQKTLQLSTEIKSSYLIEQVVYILNKIDISLTSNYTIIKETLLKNNISLGLLSSYLINIVSSTVKNLSIGFTSNYSILTQIENNATVSIQSSYEIEVL